MIENHNIEFKQIWKDDYLKSICAFANAQGGTLYIGLDDDGKIVGIDNCKKLLENLPNKIRDILGVIPEINHKIEDGKNYLKIIEERKLPTKIENPSIVKSAGNKPKIIKEFIISF